MKQRPLSRDPLDHVAAFKSKMNKVVNRFIKQKIFIGAFR